MRKIDIIILGLGALVALVWSVFANMDGFKGNDATIVARSIAITATMDGQVDNTPPMVGAWVDKNEVLARVLNGRFDRSRLIEFESQITYLQSEISNVTEQQAALATLQENFRQRASAYAGWLRSDQKLKSKESAAQLDVAKAQKRLQDKEMARSKQLYDKNLTSQVDMQIATTRAEIANKQVDLNAAQLDRSELMLQTLVRDGVFFDTGDTSYWTKIVDTLGIRHFDNLNRIAMLEAQLTQARAQAEAERARIHSSFAEEHRAPFSGMVNARYVTQGSRVNAGANLLQILDCTDPVIIISIPDNRSSEFSVGLEVTVYPIDSEQALRGHIDYISSGPLIGSDTSLQIQQEVTLDGNRAIVSLEDGQALRQASQSCETARKAVVVIHTKSILDSVAAWI